MFRQAREHMKLETSEVLNQLTFNKLKRQIKVETSLLFIELNEEVRY